LGLNALNGLSYYFEPLNLELLNRGAGCGVAVS
jgi:hypothetical protein